MKMHRIYLIVPCLLSTCMCLAQGPQQIPIVSTVSVQKVDSVTPRRYAGLVETIEHVDLVPRVTGNLLKVNFREGDIVQKGALLYELEDTTYVASIESLQAQKEALNASLTFAQNEFNRASQLRRNSIVSQSEHDKTILEINLARANLKGLEAQLKDAKNTLSYTKIYAPLTGRISKSSYTVGNLLTPQTGKLADIEMIAPIYVRFSISERTFRETFGGLNGIKKTAQVRVQLADGTIPAEVASVTLISNKINSTTNTITLWATFQNKDLTLLPGGYVTVLLSQKVGKNNLAIMPSALITDQGGYTVYVVNSANVVEARKVKTGAVSNGLITIENGLNGTETIIADGMHKVRPGMTVNPVAVKGK